MAVTLEKIDGFEHGIAATGVGGIYDALAGTPAITTTRPRTGARGLEINTAGVAESLGYNVAGNIVSEAFYVNLEDLPVAVATLAFFVNASGNGKVRWNPGTGKIEIQSGSVSAWTPIGPTLVADTWYRVVAEYDTSTGTATIRGSVDGAGEASVGNAQAAANTTVVRLGTDGAHTMVAYYDDWLISITDGDYEQMRDAAGHSVVSLAPSADGTHNITTSGDFDSFATTQYSNATTTSWQQIDSRPIQVANTADQVIRQELGTVANYMEHTLENLPAGSDTVQAVRIYGVHVESAASGASLAELRLLLSDNTEVLTTGNLSAIDTTEDPGTTINVRKRMTIAPAGGWDRTKVDGLKTRLGFGDNAPDVNFLSVLVEVALFAPSGTLHTRSISDGAGNTDAVSTFVVRGRSIADGAGNTDGISRLMALVRTPADPLSLADVAARAITVRRAPGDPENLSDVAAGSIVKARAVSDPANLSDATAVVNVRRRAPADPLNLSDVATRILAFVRTPADPLSLSDVATRVLVRRYTPADPLNLSDVAARVIVARRTPADPANLSDSMSYAGAGLQTRAISDSASLVDVVTRLLVYRRAIAELEGLSDGAVRVSAHVRAAADPLALADLLTYVNNLGRAVSDLESLSDAQQVIGSGLIVRELADLLEISDAIVAAISGGFTRDGQSFDVAEGQFALPYVVAGQPSASIGTGQGFRVEEGR